MIRIGGCLVLTLSRINRAPSAWCLSADAVVGSLESIQPSFCHVFNPEEVMFRWYAPSVTVRCIIAGTKCPLPVQIAPRAPTGTRNTLSEVSVSWRNEGHVSHQYWAIFQRILEPMVVGPARNYFWNPPRPGRLAFQFRSIDDWSTPTPSSYSWSNLAFPRRNEHVCFLFESLASGSLRCVILKLTCGSYTHFSACDEVGVEL